jgi:probable F420-dependent oxidoreductase
VDYADLRAAWTSLDELGVDVLFTWDHFFPHFGDPNGKHFECLTLLAAMGEVTSRAAIGSFVLATSYRNPNLVADMARTIDHTSGGRFILGIGAGWCEREYSDYGYEFGTLRDRLRALDGDLSVIKQRLSKLNPPPYGPIPIMIGADGEKIALRIVAEHADIWHANTAATPEAFSHKCDVLDRWCADVGRDPDRIERSVAVNAGASAAAVLAGRGRGADAAGAGRSVGRQWDELADAGATLMTYRLDGPFDLGPVRELLAWRDGRNRAADQSLESTALSAADC